MLSCRRRRARGAAAPLLLLSCALSLSMVPHARAALCGDVSGDGYFAASDALATLRLAVGSGYDRRGDVSPVFVDDARAGDGKLTAGDALATLRAVVEGRIPLCNGPHPTRAAVTTAPLNFDAGGFAVVDLASRTFEFRAGAVTGDAVARTQSGSPIVVNRENFNSLQLMDDGDDDLPTIKECSVADDFESNPQDVVIVSDGKGYVTPYGGGSLFVIDPAVLFEPANDPACESLITDRIDLSGFDDDGVPEMDQMVVVGDRLFVALQRLGTDFHPKRECASTGDACASNADCAGSACVAGDSGVVAVIDTTTDSVVGSIPLSFQNPFAATKGLVYDEFQKRIFTGGPGRTGDVLDDGAIEAIDPVAMQSAGVLLEGADIGANIYDFVVVGTRRVFAIVADDESNSIVDVQLEPLVVKVLLSSTALITDIEMTETGELWAAYRGESGADPSGLRVFRVTDGMELTKTKRIALGQAPFTIAFLP